VTSTHLAFTMFELSKSAILLIDHQVDTMQLVKYQPIDRVRRFALALAKTAVALEIPLVATSS
jgi:nicotinamidase-related amidase